MDQGGIVNPYLIERLAHERILERLHRAETDARLHAAGHRIVRRPFRDVPSIGTLLRRRRHEPCSTAGSCHA